MSEHDDEKFVRPEVVESSEEETHKDEQGNIVLSSQVLPEWIYLLATEGKPVFPGLRFPVQLPPGKMAETLKTAAQDVPQRVLGVVLSREETSEDEETRYYKFYRTGTAVRILRVQEDGEGNVQALLQGMSRFRILKAIERDEKLIAQVAYLEDVYDVDDEELRALGLSIMNTMRELVQYNPMYSEEIRTFLSRSDTNEAGQLADFAVTMTSASGDELQEIVECLNVKDRVEQALFLLRKEVNLNQLKEKITSQIEEKISQQQREYFLREQLKAIKQELGIEKDEKTEEIERYEKKLEELKPHLPDEAASRINEELDKFRLLSPQSPEFAVSRNYLDWLTGLPWGSYSRDRLDVRRARSILNRDHYGLQDVKQRILEFLGVAKLKGSVEGNILCLIGPPGVGKTSLGKAIAEALGRDFYRFSLGGMRDEAEIKGHRRTYIGAMPGKFMQALHSVGTSNPVIMLDEIDKVGASFQGDPASALLEVLDPEQNTAFRDHYLDVPYDLSKVLFITTANVPDTIPSALFDRMEQIHLAGYIPQEKISISKRHLVPRLLSEHGLEKTQARFTDAALRRLVEDYARESGVRDIEKAISSCLRKVATQKAEKKSDGQVVVNPAKVQEFLGKPRFAEEPLRCTQRSGVATGLAWTPLGGSVLYVEAISVPGEQGIKLTGQLGGVMSESSHIAYSLVTSAAVEMGVPAEYFRERTVHVHVPAGATKKDGPSAGITMATALLSLALDRPLPTNWAMSGELTLTGSVLPVGGVREKMVAAQRAKIKNVILPKENQKDYDEIPEKVVKGITPHFVTDYRQVFNLMFPKKKKTGKQ